MGIYVWHSGVIYSDDLRPSFAITMQMVEKPYTTEDQYTLYIQYTLRKMLNSYFETHQQVENNLYLIETLVNHYATFLY